ncbi:hypothetical protein PDE_03156 [Penicillium oxalicum 114-2]|uniref:HAUS augmin-like complex subunit 6 N-terminal domain-containing protein n=1 Tax=Penicillium oxalicum (strain 114-2 / CGMCC 5302) TaxID=933388 RepID=S7ZC52_PENO1|nr:hypothetical protein PDE_03156 [Penicillium oxalicum 114-2]
MAAPRVPRPRPLDWTGPSQLAIFVRNLKLLHLDRRNDWPGITLHALSPSSQNQRQRIRLIEWSLYHLFMIWDSELTQNKLRPFFPPLEHLQSVNLRAALFRALAELKKNGDLGRETILRKTMLDDCRGEKFEEVLAVFSTAVLRKLLALSATEMIWNPAMAISTASAITPVDYQNLVPLIIAHRFSLNATGARRARFEETFARFSGLLDDKRVELTKRAEQTKGISNREQNLSQTDSEALVQELRTNWMGNVEWATALQHGGSRTSSDAFLERPFPQAWKQASQSTTVDVNDGAEIDLVTDLETRVLRLRGRLRKWHEFNDSLREKCQIHEGHVTPTLSRPRLMFRDHQSLTVASISKTVRASADRGRELNEADRSFMAQVNAAITRTEDNSRVDQGADATAHLPELKLSRKPRATKPSEFMTEVNHDDRERAIPSIALYEPHTHTGSSCSESIPSSPPPPANLPPAGPGDDAQSDEDEEATLPQPPQSQPYNLVERTRKSMSLIPPLPAQESHHLPKRRGPRPSFPVNQFETPRKPSGADISRCSTPKDKLFEEDADYASVFKSRPRIALSPISSPAVHVSPSIMEGESFDLGYDEGALEDMDSPSITSRYRS